MGAEQIISGALGSVHWSGRCVVGNPEIVQKATAAALWSPVGRGEFATTSFGPSDLGVE
jgi:hypothetical protein